MALTLQQLDNVANAALDYHLSRGEVFSQSIQDKPLLREMTNRKKTFPGGKGNITIRVKGDYTTTVQGYSGDDTVSYKNPANIKTATFPWKELHWGIQVTLTELKNDGITVSDSATGQGESEHSDRDATVLANLFEDKIEDMAEGSARDLNRMYWLDGTQDSKKIPGIKSFIVDAPTSSAIIGGLDPVVNTWWQNRANLAIAVGVDPAAQVLVNFLQTELRQLRRYGSPDHIALCGSDFLTQLEKELRAKGNYTLEGWAKSGKIDVGMADVSLKGINFEYDPTLDDMGETKRCYILDTKSIMPMVMDGEYMKKHNPARPAEKYVLYRAVTLTAGLVVKQRNTSGVYAIV